MSLPFSHCLLVLFYLLFSIEILLSPRQGFVYPFIDQIIFHLEIFSFFFLLHFVLKLKSIIVQGLVLSFTLLLLRRELFLHKLIVLCSLGFGLDTLEELIPFLFKFLLHPSLLLFYLLSLSLCNLLLPPKTSLSV